MIKITFKNIYIYIYIYIYEIIESIFIYNKSFFKNTYGIVNDIFLEYMIYIRAFFRVQKIAKSICIYNESFFRRKKMEIIKFIRFE